jgi:hypothetical protein
MRRCGHGDSPYPQKRSDDIPGEKAFKRSSSGSSRKLCADRFDLAQGSGFGEFRALEEILRSRSPHLQQKSKQRVGKYNTFNR